MDRYERILTLHRILKNARYAVPMARLKEELACSRATLYRDIAFLRDSLYAPIESQENDSGETAVGYARDEADRFELPGMWLTSEELSALLVLNELMGRSEPGVLAGTLEPFRARIEKLLTIHNEGPAPPIDRIRVIASAARPLDQTVFRVTAGALLSREKMKFSYRARSTNTPTDRTVSPQRLTHYRDNWYLDAWDHEREGLRSFALDRVRDARSLGEPALDHAGDQLDEHLASSYGIFSGPAKAWATIRFSPHASRWVADEHWHRLQEGNWLGDGRYELKVPYSNSRELLMDVLRYGPDAEVVSPVSLREEMRILLQLSIGSYQ
ncbi:MAG: YafY family protein [Dokdonella sp.]